MKTLADYANAGQEENPDIEVIPDSEVETVEDPNNEAASAQDAPPVVTSTPEDAAAFDAAFPGFAGQLDNLPADMQARMWRNLAMAKATVTKPDEAEGSSRPPIRDLPPADLGSLTERYKEALEAGETETALKVQQEIVNFQGAALETLSDYAVRNEWDNQQLSSRIDSLNKPMQIRTAGASVPGFQDSDVAAAQALMDSGKVPDPALAVKFVVYDRLSKSNSAPPLSAAQEADRVAKAAAAASAPSSQTSAPATGPVNSANFNSPAWKARFAQNLKAKQEQT